MRSNKGFLATIAVLVLFCVSASSSASTIQCNGCTNTQYKTSAKNAGVGQHFVMDLTNAKLTFWEVEFVPDGPLYIAYALTIPSGIEVQFLNILEQKTQAKLSGNPGLVITVDANNPTGASTMIVDPLGAWVNSNAYDVVSNPGVRNSIGASLANGYTGAVTGSSTLNSAIQNLVSTLMSASTAFTSPISIRIVITWKDGSKTTYEMSSGDVAEAKYVNGESRDERNQPIPDPAFTDPTTGGGYSGTYTFNTNNAIDDWLNAAAQAGIQITGGSSGLRLSCSWVNTTLTCKRLNQ